MRIAARNRLTVVATLAVSAALAACGGGSSDSASSGPKSLDKTTSTERSTPTTTGAQATTPSQTGTSSIIVPGDPEKAIRGAIEAVLAPHPPGAASAQTACGYFVTDRYLKSTYGNRQGCIRALVPGSAADTVKVSGVVIDADRGIARAIPRGGPSSGETIAVKLVRQGSVWKIDSLRSNAPVGP